MQNTLSFFFFVMDGVSLQLPPRRCCITTQERRRSAKVEHARKKWLGKEMDLEMVHDLKHDNAEMRWLAELFPLEEGDVSVEVVSQRLGEWCAAHPDDARALTYLAMMRQDRLLLEAAASMGDGRALAKLFFSSASPEKKFQVTLASAQKGDAEGTLRLWECFMEGIGCKSDWKTAREMLERAADLGCLAACFHLLGGQRMEELQSVKLKISFFGIDSCIGSHSFDVGALLRWYASDVSLGGILFDLGELHKGNIDVVEGKVFGQKFSVIRLKSFVQLVVLYDTDGAMRLEMHVLYGF